MRFSIEQCVVTFFLTHPLCSERELGAHKEELRGRKKSLERGTQMRAQKKEFKGELGGENKELGKRAHIEELKKRAQSLDRGARKDSSELRKIVHSLRKELRRKAKKERFELRKERSKLKTQEEGSMVNLESSKRKLKA
ncbi:hypothetical protein VNO78_28913 [Psophocarpus tetragonolobus]|uniref:Uncharacterized protein n=1 Tax=Psophocarpus tetragonolobus TaxID=3891 RepID=A0AAN9RU01_PSOTE